MSMFVGAKLACDRSECGWALAAGTEDEARQCAEREGWSRVGERDFCPHCTRKRAERPKLADLLPGYALMKVLDAARAAGFTVSEEGDEREVTCCGEGVSVESMLGCPHYAECDNCGRAIADATSARPDDRIRDLPLPTLEHAYWLEPDPRAGNLRSYEVCGRKLMESAKAEQYLETVRRFVQAYGERARMAERSEGVDWKAISHALRAGYQTRLILTQGGFTFPLPETETLILVKRGGMPYPEAAAMLEDLIDEVDALSKAAAHLPEKADRRWWDEWLLRWVRREINRSPEVES